MVQIYPEDRAKALDDYGGAGTVQIMDSAFVPSQVVIHKGTTVSWVNKDGTLHKIEGMNFESNILKKGGSYSHTFTKAGVYEYYCGINQGLRGTIKVI